MGRPLLILFVLCVAFFPVPAASYTHYKDAESCNIIGDGDIYGIGIRVGLYIQCFAALIIIITGDLEGLYTLRIGFNAVGTALIINLLKDVHIYHNEFIYMEFWIVSSLLLFILFPFTWISTIIVLSTKYGEVDAALRSDLESRTFPIRRFRAEIKAEIKKNPALFHHIGYFSSAWTFLLSAVILGTQIWLYFSGLHLGHNPDCEAKVNFYGNINMYDYHWVALLRAISIFGAIATPIILGLSLAYTISGFTLFTLRKTHSHKEINKPKAPTGVQKATRIYINFRRRVLDASLTYNTLKGRALNFLLWCVFLIISTVVWVEKTIQVNNIDLSETPILSSSQLIALLVAIFTSLPVLWAFGLELVKCWSGKRGENQHSQGASECQSRNESALGRGEMGRSGTCPEVAGEGLKSEVYKVTQPSDAAQ